MNLGDEYQNFLIFIALLITGDEGWMLNLWWFPPHLSLAMKIGDRAYCHGGNQALENTFQKFKSSQDGFLNILQYSLKSTCVVESLF